jgi:hypothetical protein
MMRPLMRAKWVWQHRRHHAVMICTTAIAALMVLSKQETAAPIVPATLWNISSMRDAPNIPGNTENRYDLLVMLNETGTR